MREKHLACIAGALLLASTFVSAPPQTGSRGTLQGIVLRGTSDEPVPNATVELLPRPTATSAAGSRGTTTTDSGGRFLFTNLDAGDYVVRVRANGYVEQVFPGRDTGLKLVAGPSLSDVMVRLIPTGVVTGRLVDRSGQPVGDVPVELKSEESQAQALATRSNDRGEYRFFFLTPGPYLLTAGQGSSARVVRSNGAARRFPEEFALTYYPGVPDRESARVVNVKPGEELTGLDMVMGDPRVPIPREPVLPPPPAGPAGPSGTEAAPAPPVIRGQ